MNKVIEVTLTSMSHDGRAVGRLADGEQKGIAVFVENAVMGQKVQAIIKKEKKKYIEASCVTVLSENENVSSGICSHSQDCGGCTWQKMVYTSQAKEKENIVYNALKRLGGISVESKAFLPIITPLSLQTETTCYRNKMEFSFAYINGKQQLGLKQKNSHTIIEVTDCKLMPQKAMVILDTIRTATRDYTGDFLKYTVLRNFLNKWTVEIITKPFSKYDKETEKALIQSCYLSLKDLINGFIHSIRESSFNVAYGEKNCCVYGETLLFEELTVLNQTNKYALGNTAFFQVNKSMTQVLYGEIAKLAQTILPEKNAHVWDIYCGVGSIGLSLLPLFSENSKAEISNTTIQYKKPFLLGVEAVEEAILLAKQNAEQNNCSFAKFEVNSAKKLGQYFKRFSTPNLIILDPPRAGIEEEAIKAILANSVPYLILVSCNPTTLARDLALLQEQYEIKTIQPVDLFPHTPHVETIILLAKK